jgi:predicted small lipoprotein YifL
MTIDLRLLLSVCMLALGLQGCGLKGDLYLENPQPGEGPPPSVELDDPVSEPEDEFSADSDVEDVGVGDGVPAAEPGVLENEAPSEHSAIETDASEATPEPPVETPAELP